jgi:hypothetical protein
MYRFISISRAYFSKIDEESVKNNFVLIYELLDGEYRRCLECPECLLIARDHGLWLSAKLRDRHAQDVHNNGEHKIGIGSCEW